MLTYPRCTCALDLQAQAKLDDWTTTMERLATLSPPTTLEGGMTAAIAMLSFLTMWKLEKSRRLVSSRKLCDRYLLQGLDKGGHIWWKPKDIVFTSNTHPFEWWPNMSQFDRDAIERRINDVVVE